MQWPKRGNTNNDPENLRIEQNESPYKSLKTRQNFGYPEQ